MVRHGQSRDNVSPVFQSDHAPLSQPGIAQAGKIAERLSKIVFETLIASPLERAAQTAHIIAAKTGHGIIFSDLFVERRKPSEIDGKPWSGQTANATWRAWSKTLYAPGERVSDGENYDDLVNRADQALDFLPGREEQTLAVVMHGYFMRVMLARLLLGDNLTAPILKRFMEKTEIENTSITVLNYRDAFEQGFEWRLWTMNDHSHFAE